MFNVGLELGLVGVVVDYVHATGRLDCVIVFQDMVEWIAKGSEGHVVNFVLEIENIWSAQWGYLHVVCALRDST
jgi:hypothetical protein